LTSKGSTTTGETHSDRRNTFGAYSEPNLQALSRGFQRTSVLMYEE
jgi:hypothetical protein